MWYLLAGTRGGEMRAKILYRLHQKPLNANQLATALGVDYKTIQHHLIILTKNGVLTSHGAYGAVYFLSDGVDWKQFEEIWERIRNM